MLVIAFDLLSAPAHHHHHDGVEGLLEFVTAHAALEDVSPHAEGDEHPLTSHSALAIRVDPLRLAQLPVVDHADTAAAITSLIAVLAAPDEPRLTNRRPDRLRSDFRSYRSLPPAGRAPPLHA